MQQPSDVLQAAIKETFEETVGHVDPPRQKIAILRYRGRQLSLRSGKAFWAAPGYAKSALKYEQRYLVREIYHKLNVTGEVVAWKDIEAAVQEWADKNVEVATVTNDQFF